MQINNFSYYEFYEDGRVYSYKAHKFLSPSLDRDGYLNLDCIDDNGKRVRYKLNNWICRAFYGEPPFEMDQELLKMRLVTIKQSANMI